MMSPIMRIHPGRTAVRQVGWMGLWSSLLTQPATLPQTMPLPARRAAPPRLSHPRQMSGQSGTDAAAVWRRRRRGNLACRRRHLGPHLARLPAPLSVTHRVG